MSACVRKPRHNWHVNTNTSSESIRRQRASTLLQVLLRFQWVMEVMRGQSTHMALSLEGLATSVMGGLQDELFNLTLDKIQVSRTFYAS